MNLEAILYRPTLLACASVRFIDQKYSLDTEVVRDALVNELDRRGTLKWDEFPYNGPGMEKLEEQPAPQARFVTPDAPYVDLKLINSLKKDFSDWVLRTTQVVGHANQAMKLFAGPNVSTAQFRTTCAGAARQMEDAEISKQTSLIDRQLGGLKEKLSRAQRDLNQNQVEYDNRKREETGNMLEFGAGILGFGRKKTLTSQLTKNRMSQQARVAVDDSNNVIAQLKEQISQLEQNRQQVVQSTHERWGVIANQVSDVPLLPKKGAVYIQVFGVAWQPFYILNSGSSVLELPAFGAE